MYKINRIKSSKISLSQYYDFCLNVDISPNFHPSFVEFYFSQLRKKPKIIGRFDNQGQLIAAYPVLYGQIFPNSLHKRLLGKKTVKLGDIGQPEALFPVIRSAPKLSLNCFSPTTSPILRGVVKGIGKYSLKSIAIAKKAKHKSATRAQKRFFKEGGKIYFTDEEDLEINDFADIYISLHGQKWCHTDYDLRYIRNQIIQLSQYIFGGILFKGNEPFAAHLCFKNVGKAIYYVDAINIGIKQIEKPKWYESYGSILLLASLRKAEERSHSLGKALRYSYGYFYGPKDYKHLWAQPEKTYIAF